mmetsp:Transcript_30602/g.57974  ORF Transcript_30602/g.57974 Transcript_30602/m.57974 type:complete len:1242 (+) Transcript_30602:93-3818(+)
MSPTALPTMALVLLAVLTILLSSMTPTLAHDVSSLINVNNNNMTTSNDDAASCPIIALLPFTNKGTKPMEQLSIHAPIDHMAATLLAIDHFNTRNPSVVSELSSSNPIMSSCDVTIPVIPGYTILDDGDFTTYSIANILKAQKERGDICAVVGPYRNKAALGAGHTTGAIGTPLISYGAADTAKLGRLHLYPLTIKMTADGYMRADAVMGYLKELGREYVTLLHTTDLLDHAKKVLDLAAQKHGVIWKTEAIKPPFTKTEGAFSVPNAMQRIKESGYRTTIVALYTGSYWQHIEKYADEYGLSGPDAGHFWMAWDTVDISLLTAKTDSASRFKLLNGMGTINMLDKFAYEGDEDPFLQSWRSQNASFVKRMNELNPIERQEDGVEPPGYYYVKDDYFTKTRRTPSLYSSYIYDSIVSIGLGACMARAKELREQQEQSNNRGLQMVKWPNTGTSNNFFNELVTVEFEGASGSVVLHDEKLYNRDPNTIPFGMYNLRLEEGDPISGGGITQHRGFEPVLTSYKLPGKNAWSSVENGQDFLYADGTPNQPIKITAKDPEDPIVKYLIIGFVSAGVVAAILVYFYVVHMRRKADSVWSVVPSELKFHEPPEVIGQGTFGLVVLAEYRGTQVAVKRVIPVLLANENVSGCDDNFELSNVLVDGTTDSGTMETEKQGLESSDDIETGVVAVGQDSSGDTKSMGFKSNAFTESDHEGSGKIWTPSTMTKNKLQKRLRNDFIAEMRYLSKLRHPCITTVMGAVLAKKHDPMLVMEYMDHGSLHDLLHNETLFLEGDLVLPILRDIAQGLRFLHAANPQVIHGDLKSANVLVDSKFRAKVADFGLSQKKALGATGTPYWMAPELLRNKSSATTHSDVYSFGIILYEVYSRKDPYEGENYHDVISMIADPHVNKRPPVPKSCPKSVAGIMKNCLKMSGEFRPTAEELDKELKRLDVNSAGPMMIGKKKDENEHALLYELLPKHVADVLRTGGKVEPESKELVTIFFSDIVGFTNISSELTPIKISEMLDRLYAEFDELSQKHNVFKVETIGDAYMAVTNLIEDQAEDHAKRIAEFSLDAIKAANRTMIDIDEPDKGYIQIRVGFHSGPVVANVVGTRNPRYCLFGDTVNTASRMESNSKVNRIHCSARTAGLLLMQWPELALEHRGRVKIKGKGEMRTFWVNEPNSQKRKDALRETMQPGRLTPGAQEDTGGGAKRRSLVQQTMIQPIVEDPDADADSGDGKPKWSRRLTQ